MLLLHLFVLISTSLLSIQGYEPDFAEGLSNLTVPVGREAVFSCLVEHLGGYRVGWVKADTKAIQAIHEHVITHNPRVSVSHSGHTTWSLHIRAVEESDRGTYMCQINTDPMKSVMGFLDVVVPPDIVDEESSGDVSVAEGGSVSLVCKARGYPQPEVVWKREDRADIIFRDIHGLRRVGVQEGPVLRLSRVSRSDMGHYMCLASNGVPPAVSKRISLNVHFAPVVMVPNQLVGAPLGTDVTLACHVEASPKAIIYWTRDSSLRTQQENMNTRAVYQKHLGHLKKRVVSTSASSGVLVRSTRLTAVQSGSLGSEETLSTHSFGTLSDGPEYDVRYSLKTPTLGVLLGDTMVVSSDKYETKVSVRSLFESRMLLTVRSLGRTDVGTYRCVAKNSLGEGERNIRLYEIPGAVGRSYSGEDDEEDEGGGSGGPTVPAVDTEPPPGRHEHTLVAPSTAAHSTPPSLLTFLATSLLIESLLTITDLLGYC